MRSVSQKELLVLLFTVFPFREEACHAARDERVLTTGAGAERRTKKLRRRRVEEVWTVHQQQEKDYRRIIHWVEQQGIKYGDGEPLVYGTTDQMNPESNTRPEELCTSQDCSDQTMPEYIDHHSNRPSAAPTSDSADQYSNPHPLTFSPTFNPAEQPSVVPTGIGDETFLPSSPGESEAPSAQPTVSPEAITASPSRNQGTIVPTSSPVDTLAPSVAEVDSTAPVVILMLPTIAPFGMTPVPISMEPSQAPTSSTVVTSLPGEVILTSSPSLAPAEAMSDTMTPSRASATSVPTRTQTTANPTIQLSTAPSRKKASKEPSISPSQIEMNSLLPSVALGTGSPTAAPMAPNPEPTRVGRTRPPTAAPVETQIPSTISVEPTKTTAPSATATLGTSGSQAPSLISNSGNGPSVSPATVSPTQESLAPALIPAETFSPIKDSEVPTFPPIETPSPTVWPSASAEEPVAIGPTEPPVVQRSSMAPSQVTGSPESTPVPTETKVPQTESPSTTQPTESSSAPVEIQVTSAPTPAPVQTAVESLVPSISATVPYWQQIGSTIEVSRTELTTDRDFASDILAISDDGKVVAAAATLAGIGVGYVQVFQLKAQSNEWETLGFELTSEEELEDPHTFVALSGDGLSVCVGYFGIFGGRQYMILRVYNYGATGDWEQRGADIVRSAAVSRTYGWFVEMSTDGTTVAVAGPFQPVPGVSVYAFSGGGWSQKGGRVSTTRVETSTDLKCSLSGDGTAFGLTTSLYTQIYRFQDGSWSEQGISLSGGDSVSLSGDGRAVSIARVSGATAYTLIGNSQEWVQTGEELVSDPEDSLAYYTVSMASDGRSLIVTNVWRGTGSVFQFSGREWFSVGSNIVVEDPLQVPMVLSAQGNAVVATTSDGLQVFMDEVPTPAQA